MPVTSDADAQWEPAVRCGFVAIPDEERVKGHNVRVPDSAWAKFGRRVRVVRQTRTSVINQFIDWYDHEPGARLPQRPEKGAEDLLPDDLRD